MKDQQINIAVSNGQKELHILEGKLADPINLVPIEFKNLTIEGPAEYYLKNKNAVDSTPSVIIVDTEKNSIQLIHGFNHPHKVEVTGSLKKHPDYARLCVNGNTTFSRDQLENLMRFMKRYFVDVKQYVDIMQGIEKLVVSYSRKIEASDDKRGNSKHLLNQVMKDNSIPESVALKIPMFIGEEPQDVELKLCMKVESTSYIEFWFMSVDADTKEKEIAQASLDAAINQFGESCPPVLYR